MAPVEMTIIKGSRKKVNALGKQAHQPFIYGAHDAAPHNKADERAQARDNHPFLWRGKSGAAQQGVNTQRRESLQGKNYLSPVVIPFVFLLFVHGASFIKNRLKVKKLNS
jgi:hypothetical protein